MAHKYNKITRKASKLLREGRISDALNFAVRHYKVKLKIKFGDEEKEAVNNITDSKKFFLAAFY